MILWPAHKLLPQDVQHDLKTAAMVSPGLPAGTSLVRTRALEEVIERAKARHPELFRGAFDTFTAVHEPATFSRHYRST